MENNNNYQVTLSQPTLHSDNGQATLTMHQLCELLDQLDIDIVNNRNMFANLKGNRLHLNTYRNAGLAVNKEKIRKL